MNNANMVALERHLAGKLDTTGHHVEIREEIRGGYIVKSLFIDGEG